MELWWICPKCGEKVSFSKEMADVFDDDGSANFDAKSGIYYHTIMCDCGAYWVMSLSGMCDSEINNHGSGDKNE